MAKTPAPATNKRKSGKAKPLPLRTQVQHDIDRALAAAGIPSAIDADGWRWMQNPSGNGLIGVAAVLGQRDDLTLRVVAPIMPLPKAPGALLKLLRKVAALNYDVVGFGRLAIDSRTAWSVAAQHVADIGPEDVAACIFDCLWLAQATAETLKPKPKGSGRITSAASKR